MEFVKPLPSFLLQRYHGWYATSYSEDKTWYKKLATEGQRPRAMVISCCDSRVQATQIFGADQGEFFIHRNIANLVPPFQPDGQQHGTSAAVEYAVSALKVGHIIVLGHSNCGGVQGCYEMCSGQAPDLEEKTSFVGRWLEILRPAYNTLNITDNVGDNMQALEKKAVLTSLENLMTFPFVKKAVDQEELSLHGLWTDIGAGGLEAYDPNSNKFAPV